MNLWSQKPRRAENITDASSFNPINSYIQKTIEEYDTADNSKDSNSSSETTPVACIKQSEAISNKTPNKADRYFGETRPSSRYKLPVANDGTLGILTSSIPDLEKRKCGASNIKDLAPNENSSEASASRIIYSCR